ncbi:Hemolysin III [Tieghemostelium lacteum]|uniref:Hemolysin III n=1 Tax=Tieghemostelium lacteum TaxID=361077 RepID=A0A151Z986_TIELA|nr:Hemolysin III [Tieghemostelium lacteum]|eukprot:KYQ90497.1 Hemolysin III [Tieghemostelium lacteum]
MVILEDFGEIGFNVTESPEIQTHTEEVLNAVSHLLGLILCIPAVLFLISLAKMRGSKWHVLSCTIYGFSLITMYFCSTAYHAGGIEMFDLSEKHKEFLKNLDHCAIYMLIAGTQTPLMMINLIYNNLPTNNKVEKLSKGASPKVVKVGWSLFGVVWSMCFLGVFCKLTMGADGIPPFISNGFYLLMGWISVFGMKDLIRHIPKKGMKLLVTGGVTYTGGIGFLVWETQPFNHAVWHLFVSAGTLLHYFCILESTMVSKPLHPHGSREDTESIIPSHASVIIDNLEYAEKQIVLAFFGSGKRKSFIVKYMNMLYSVFLDWGHISKSKVK